VAERRRSKFLKSIPKSTVNHSANDIHCPAENARRTQKRSQQNLTVIAAFPTVATETAINPKNYWRTVTARRQYRRFVQNMRLFAVLLAFQTVTPETALNGQSTDWRTVTAPKQIQVLRSKHETFRRSSRLSNSHT
jgi:hypothetical protein